MERKLWIVKHDDGISGYFFDTQRRVTIDVFNVIGDFISIRKKKIGTDGRNRTIYALQNHIFTQLVDDDPCEIERQYDCYYEEMHREVKRAFINLKKALVIINSPSAKPQRRINDFEELKSILGLNFAVEISQFENDCDVSKAPQTMKDNFSITYKNCKSVTDLVFSMLHFYISNRYRLIQCKHCGKYAAVSSFKQTYCNRISTYRGHSQKKDKKPLACEQAVRDAKQQHARQRKSLYDKMQKATAYHAHNVYNRFLAECENHRMRIDIAPSVANLVAYDNYLYQVSQKREWTKMDMEEVVKQMDEYYERFGDMFPTMAFQNATPDEVSKMILDCLEKDKKMKVDLDVVY